MPPASPVPPLPADFRVETLAGWLYATAQAAHPRTSPGFRETPWDRLGPDGREQTRETARAVRALVEVKVREAVFNCPTPVPYESVNAIVSRVLGSAS